MLQLRSRILLTLSLIVIIGTLIIFSFRKDIAPIFNETAVILQIHDLVQKQEKKTITEFYNKNSRTIWEETSRAIAGRPIQIFYYRPLEIVVGSFIVLVSHIIYDHPYLPALINSFFLSLAAASLWFLCYLFLKDFWLSSAAAFLMMFSLASLNATWQTIGIHALVPLAINTAVISYFYLKKTGNSLWILPILFIGCLGPLYKEYIGIIIIMLLFCETVALKRSWLFIGLLLALFCYSVCPALWINLIAFHRVALASSYTSLGVWNKIITLDFRFDFLAHYLFALPPTIVFLGLLSIFMNVFNLFEKSILWLIAGVGGAIGFFSLLAGGIELLGRSGIALFSLALVLLVAISALKIHKMFPIIFIVSWLPCLLVFRNEIYLMYSLGFLTIILCFNIRLFLKQLLAVGHAAHLKLLYVIIVISLAAGFLDQTLNLVAVTRVSQAMNHLTGKLTKTLATDLSSSDTDGPAYFLSNNRFAKDIQFNLYQNEHVALPVNDTLSFALDPYYATPEQLLGILQSLPAKSKTYLLKEDNSFDQSSSKIRFKANPPYIFERIDSQTLNVKYPYLDILKYFLPEKYISFPGNPDLEIYFQKRQGPFWREITGKFNLYRLSYEHK